MLELKLPASASEHSLHPNVCAQADLPPEVKEVKGQ